jgi:hypothetical protein
MHYGRTLSTFRGIKSLYLGREGGNLRQKIDRFPRQHGVTPQKTVLLKNKYAEIMKEPDSHSSNLSYYLKSSLCRN